jgi:protein FrlC
MIYLDYVTLEEAIRRIAKVGYQGVDIWAYSPHLDPMRDRGDRESIRKLSADLELEIVALSVVGGALAREYNFSYPKEWVRSDTIDYYKRCVELAAQIGCPRINLISGHMMWDTDFQQVWAWNREGMGEVVDYAASHNVMMCLHTLTPSESRVIVTLDDAIQMMREINSPSCKLMIDTADQNITEANLSDSVRKVAPYLEYVHISDNEGHGLGLTHNIPGHGTVNWGMFVGTLKEAGYKGYVTAQLYAAHPIDPDVWQHECYRYMRKVFEECGVWEG